MNGADQVPWRVGFLATDPSESPPPHTDANAPPDTAVVDVSCDRKSAFDRQDAADEVAGASPRADLKVRERMLSLAQLRDMPRPVALIAGVFDLDSIVIAYGRRAAAKSLIAAAMTAAVALGERWHGSLVTQSPAIYVVAEGASGTSQRYEAWQSEHAPLRQPPGPEQLLILPEAVNLMNGVSVAAFADAAVEMGAKFIVFDTLARCMVGGDENSAKDAGVAIAHLDVIRRCTGACVLVIHHSGKDATAGGRGSSAFEAAADTVLEITNVDGLVTIKCTKQKNHAEPLPIRLQLRPTGDSAVLVNYRATAEGIGAGALETLTALSEITVTGGVSASAWRLSSGKSEPTFYRHRKDLLTLGLVSNVGTDKQPRYQVSDAGTLALSQDSHDSQR